MHMHRILELCFKVNIYFEFLINYPPMCYLSVVINNAYQYKLQTHI